MAETTIRTLVCSVMFLDLVDYSKRSVGDQQHMKQTFNELLARALEPVPPRDFIVLDTGDGAAIAFLGDPEDALSAGIAVRKSIASLPPAILSARMGINLGPVRLVWDINAQMNILGDGINVAQRVMSFAEPGQLLASRSFYEVVSRLSRTMRACSATLAPAPTSMCASMKCMRSPRGRVWSARRIRRDAAEALAAPTPTKPISTSFPPRIHPSSSTAQRKRAAKKAPLSRPRSSRPGRT